MPPQEWWEGGEHEYFLRRVRDHAAHLVRSLAQAYAGMLSSGEGHQFNMRRIYLITKAVWFECVRRQLLEAYNNEHMWKNVGIMVELLKIAELKEHVKHPLMSDETAALLSLDWDGLQNAEAPHLTEIAGVDWLATEVYTLVEPKHHELYVELREHKRRLVERAFPTPEAPAPEAAAPEGAAPQAPVPDVAAPEVSVAGTYEAEDGSILEIREVGKF